MQITLIDGANNFKIRSSIGVQRQKYLHPLFDSFS